MVAKELFSPEDRAAISAAVAEAEKKTEGEIVPVVATTSATYERAEDRIAFAGALVAIGAVWTFFYSSGGTGWDGESLLQLPAVLLAALAGYLLGGLLARLLPPLKRLAISGKAMEAATVLAAAHAFDSLKVRGTVAKTGVVIYVSLFEHRVCVWGDAAIASKIPEAEWKELCGTLIRGLKSGKPREAFLEAIHRCGEILSKQFPLKPGDVNELSNELRILD